MSNNRSYVDDSGRILPHNQSNEWEDDNEDDPEFSTYFSDQKVEIPSFPDDDKVNLNFVCHMCLHLKKLS